MVDFTYGDLATNTSTLSPDVLRNNANAAAELVCGIYEQYPTGILPSIGSTPISELTDAMLRNLCRPRGQLPAPRQVPFSGGQCPCVNYNVDYSLTNSNGVTFSSGTTMIGPVTSVAIEQTGFNGSGEVQVGVRTRGGSAACGGPRVSTDLAGSTPPLTINSISVTRQDGQPDSCGSPAPQYTEPASQTNFNTTVNISAGGVTVPVSVTFIPTLFAPVNIFRPELNVDVGGINVNFQLDGVRFSPTVNINSPITLPRVDPRPLPPAGRNQTEVDCPDLDLSGVFTRFDNIDDQLDAIQACACGPDQTIQTTQYGPANSRTISLPAQCIGVRVIVTQQGVNLPGQFGNGGAPDVIFVGWCSFGNGSPAGLRVPINHETSFFFAPERATAFSYTTVYNSLARLEVVYLQDNP